MLPPGKMFGECCGVRFYGGEKGANAISWGDLSDTSAPRAEPPARRAPARRAFADGPGSHSLALTRPRVRSCRWAQGVRRRLRQHLRDLRVGERHGPARQRGRPQPQARAVSAGRGAAVAGEPRSRWHWPPGRPDFHAFVSINSVSGSRADLRGPPRSDRVRGLRARARTQAAPRRASGRGRAPRGRDYVKRSCLDRAAARARRRAGCLVCVECRRVDSGTKQLQG